MIKKILIANRGEIAVRIVRACAEMGIRSVAIFSDADRHALHVKRADEAHSIGAEPLAGYLNPRKLVNLAVETIKAHRKRICGKLGVHDRTHAVTLAARRGYINPFASG